MMKKENDSNFWAMRCKLNDYDKLVTPDEVARFREEYADAFRLYKDAKGNRIYTEAEVQFEAYEYYDDKEIAAYILQGQTPQGLADIMSM